MLSIQGWSQRLGGNTICVMSDSRSTGAVIALMGRNGVASQRSSRPLRGRYTFSGSITLDGEGDEGLYPGVSKPGRGIGYVPQGT